MALRTPTLPPAQHTNCYLVGTSKITVLDPGSPWEEEQQRLLTHLTARIQGGATVERILLSHRHHDHVAGAAALRASLADLGLDVPIVAHTRTAEWLTGNVVVDHCLKDNDLIACDDRQMRALWTPGHAPGHLAFYDRHSGALLVGDLVASEGTIAIDPSDGNLADYLASLERVRDLAPTILLPSHGQPITAPRERLEHYITHRHMRSAQICAALDAHGPSKASLLVGWVYPDIDPRAVSLATAQIESHLLWLKDQGQVHREGDLYRRGP